MQTRIIILFFVAALLTETLQSPVKNGALVYVENLASNFNNSAKLTKGKITYLGRLLEYEYEVTKNLSRQQNLENILDLNSKAFTLNCSENLFWALNGLKFTLDYLYDACAHYEDTIKTLESFIFNTHSSIDGNQYTVNQALDYVRNCSSDASDSSNCVQEGTLAFLTILEDNSHELEMYKVKGTYFESELSTAFSACISDVTHAVTNDMDKYMVEYCCENNSD